MSKIIDFLKQFIIKALNVLVVLLMLFVGLTWIYINGAFVANIANAFRLTGYLGSSVGIQIVLVLLGLFWIPLILLHTIKR